MRALAAAVLTAIAFALTILVLKAILPGLGIIAAMTIAFTAAWVGLLGATDQAARVAERRLALAAMIVACLVLLVDSALFLRALAAP